MPLLVLLRERGETTDERMGAHVWLTRGLAGGRCFGYRRTIIMPTSVRIPKVLLEAVERRARALKISRDKLIVQALEREVRDGSQWSDEFFDRLSSVDRWTAAAVDEMASGIRANRRSKPPRQL